jgi:hypothetical protein
MRETPIVDLDVQLIDRLVAVEDTRDGVRVAIDERRKCGADALLGEAPHFEEPCLELIEIGLKMPEGGFRHVYPNLPVT